MTVRKRNLLMMCAALAVAAVVNAQTPRVQLESRGGDTRVNIAVPPLAAETPGLGELCKEMANVIAYDLEFSGLFRLLDPVRYPLGFTGFDADVTKLDRGAWAATGASQLVFGSVAAEGDQIVGRFRLFDLATGDQVVGQELRVARQFARLAAHRFSEEIVKYTDGEPGIGSSEIVFSAGKTGQKEIWVADYDGANARAVTKHGSISIKPKISPDGGKIAYLSYKDRYTYLYVFDRRSGTSTPLSKEVGLNIAPAWSPDGRTIALTLSKDGNTEIYLKNADGSNPRRLTHNRDGDTSPSFSPDGKRIVFVSDRGGSPQVYTMNADGSGQTRLSLQGGNSYDPVWSPDGQWIAYVVERKGASFQIYIIPAEGGDARQVTSGSGNESPSWSADSRNVIFMSSRSGGKQLWTVNLLTGEERKVPGLQGQSCEGPTWGPRRQ